MSRTRFWVAAGFFGVACLGVSAAHSQQGAGVVIEGKRSTPAPQPIAETKLLMNGLAATNLRGLAKILREKPTEAEAWTFARGQSLIIAETGNLLLIRPPRTNGKEAWLGHAEDLRDAADKLARATAAKDYPKARAGLAAVANVCNRCHQAFQVQQRVDPFADE